MYLGFAALNCLMFLFLPSLVACTERSDLLIYLERHKPKVVRGDQIIDSAWDIVCYVGEANKISRVLRNAGLSVENMTRRDNGVDVVFDGQATVVLIDTDSNAYVAHQVNSPDMWLSQGAGTESCLPSGRLNFVRVDIDEDDVGVSYRFTGEE